MCVQQYPVFEAFWLLEFNHSCAASAALKDSHRAGFATLKYIQITTKPLELTA